MAPPPLWLPTDAYFVEWLPELWFAIVLFTLAMYLFLDGFDFGIGMLYGTRQDEEEREVLLAAFGPVWDANEVWLVAFGTILLAVFPPVYADLLSDHYLLIFAIVFALLLRGTTPELREQRDDPTWRRWCSRGFVAGSVLSPLLLGMLAGAWVFGTGTVSLPALLTGLVLVALSLMAGAAYIAAKTDGQLQRDAIRSGHYATAGYLTAVVVLLSVVIWTNPAEARSTILSLPVVALVVATVVTLGGGLYAVRANQLSQWFVATGAVAFFLVGVVALLLYPTIYPSTGLEVDRAVVSPLSLNMLTVVVIPVLLIVLAYFRYLYSVFSGPIKPGETYGH